MKISGFIGETEILVLLLIFVVPIITLIDILRNRFNGNNKIIWVLVVLLTGIIGAMIYLFIGRSQKLKDDFKKNN